MFARTWRVEWDVTNSSENLRHFQSPVIISDTGNDKVQDSSQPWTKRDVTAGESF